MQEANRKRIDENPPKCGWCSRDIPKPRRYKPNVGYCDAIHKERAKVERRKQRQAEETAARIETEEATVLFAEHTVRRGQIYKRIADELSEKEWDQWVDQIIPNAEVARRVGSTSQAVGGARRAAVNDRILGLQAEEFEVADEYSRLLGPSDEFMADLLGTSPQLFEEKLDEAPLFPLPAPRAAPPRCRRGPSTRVEASRPPLPT